jgi:prophage regulatory protein
MSMILTAESSHVRTPTSPRVLRRPAASAQMNRPALLRHRPTEPIRLFARLPTVMQATGLGRSTIYRLVASGAFPAPVHVGPRAVAWRWADLDHWSASRRVEPQLVADSGTARRVQGGRSPAPANP